jgi:hypothetical protein
MKILDIRSDGVGRGYTSDLNDTGCLITEQPSFYPIGWLEATHHDSQLNRKTTERT